jgi:hypothetical protein
MEILLEKIRLLKSLLLLFGSDALRSIHGNSREFNPGKMGHDSNLSFRVE